MPRPDVQSGHACRTGEERYRWAHCSNRQGAAASSSRTCPGTGGDLPHGVSDEQQVAPGLAPSVTKGIMLIMVGLAWPSQPSASSSTPDSGAVRLLLVEGDKRLSQFLAKRLAADGFATDVASAARVAETALATSRFSAVILDVELADADGLSVLRDLRRRKDPTPVLILTSRGDVQGRIDGLRTGADDYLVKPFAFEELVARLEALLARHANVRAAPLRLGNVILDPAARQVFVGDQVKFLTLRQVGVLEILMRRSGRIVEKRLVENELFGPSANVGSNAIEVYVHRLRNKLQEAGANLQIHTVRGIGYAIIEKNHRQSRR